MNNKEHKTKKDKELKESLKELIKQNLLKE